MKNTVNYVKLPKFIFLYIVFISFYGTIAIFIDNPIFKLSKDIFLALIGIHYLSKFFLRRRVEKKTLIVIASLLLITVISALNLISHRSGYDLTDFAYGIKTTSVPMIGILLGIFLKQLKMNIYKPLYLVFFLIIIGWICQRIIGLDELMSMGFEYAVNVKTFNGNLRLPSLTGTPDAYAFLLSLSGILIEWDLRTKGRRGLANIFRVITLLFLLLATIRSAIIFWIIYQMIATLKSFFRLTRKKAYISIAFIMFLLIPIMFSGYYLINNTTLGSSSSTQDRLSHWGDNLSPLFSGEGIYGKGIGSVGSASVSTSKLSSTDSSYAVDNQFFAIYEQLGVLGVISMFFILSLIIKGCIISNKNNLLNNGNELLIALACSSMFTNCLELYPFNVILWIQLGMCYRTSYPIPETVVLKSRRNKKKRKRKFSVFETPEKRIKRKFASEKI
jgi:hypothetical protein